MLHIIISCIRLLFYISIGKKIISSRCACLGQDVLVNSPLLNRQKFRVDLPWKMGFKEILKVAFFVRMPIKPQMKDLIWQQLFNLWKISLRHSDYFIMDTYSELTDRLYFFEGLSFCCHRQDISWVKDPFMMPGSLLGDENITNHYREFFNALKKYNNHLKIIVIIFPVKFETREKYRMQYDSIRKALQNCIDMGIQIIELPISEIHKDPIDEYPYHFDAETINNFKVQVLNAMENS